MLSTMPNNNAFATYKQASVETATPEKLLIMLFNGGIKFIKQAEKALEIMDIPEADRLLNKVQDIISELMFTLDLEKGGEVAHNLYKLYEFYLNVTMQANIKKDVKHLKSVLEFFETFRDTWIEAAQKARIGAR